MTVPTGVRAVICSWSPMLPRDLSAAPSSPAFYHVAADADAFRGDDVRLFQIRPYCRRADSFATPPRASSNAAIRRDYGAAAAAKSISR